MGRSNGRRALALCLAVCAVGSMLCVLPLLLHAPVREAGAAFIPCAQRVRLDHKRLDCVACAAQGGGEDVIAYEGRSFEEGSQSLRLIRKAKKNKEKREDCSRTREDGLPPEDFESVEALGLPVPYKQLRGIQGWASLPILIPTDLPWDVPTPVGASRWLATPNIIAGELLVLAGALLVIYSFILLNETDEGLYPDLVKKGPFGVVRHPIYSGYLVVSAGMCLQTLGPIRLVASLVLAVVCFLKTSAEERSLARDKGEKWDQYCKEVPHIFIPSLI